MRGREVQNPECQGPMGNGGEGNIGVQREGCSPREVGRRQVVEDERVNHPQAIPPGTKWDWSLKSMEGTLVSTWMARHFPWEEVEFACDHTS